MLVCNNCGNKFALNGIENSDGACNPVPITEANKTVTVDTYLSELEVKYLIIIRI